MSSSASTIQLPSRLSRLSLLTLLGLVGATIADVFAAAYSRVDEIEPFGL